MNNKEECSVLYCVVMVQQLRGSNEKQNEKYRNAKHISGKQASRTHGWFVARRIQR